MQLLPADLAKVWKRELFYVKHRLNENTQQKPEPWKDDTTSKSHSNGTVVQRLVTHQTEQAMGAAEGGKLLEGME